MVAPRGMVERERVQTIEGQRVLVVDRKPPLPRKFPDLLHAMFVSQRWDRPHGSGPSSLCDTREHRMRNLVAGRHVGLDGVVRDLVVQMCADCEAVCVRDVSLDVAVDGERVPQGHGGPRRRNEILGWYSGKRRAGREYT